MNRPAIVRHTATKASSRSTENANDIEEPRSPPQTDCYGPPAPAIYTATNAGSTGVPVAMVTGDEPACAEARVLLGDVEAVELKKGVDRYSPRCSRGSGPSR
jgi:D-aminopeptidase